jgi:alpha-1,3-rhamnosyl/mannosyltransferase
VLEAMCRGIPVICSDSGSLPEIAGGAALLHNPRDARQLAAHITRLWNDPAERAALGERGMRRAAQFSWDLAAQQTLMVYRQA